MNPILRTAWSANADTADEDITQGDETNHSDRSNSDNQK